MPELLVAIAIVALLATITVVNFRIGQRRDTLNFAADEAAANLRNAQVAAISGEILNGEAPDGYGLRFVDGEDFYTYFADRDSSYDFSEGDDVIRIFEFPENVSLSVDGGELDVAFRPPRPTIYINGEDSSQEASFSLEHEDIDRQKIITINRISGRVDIE